MKKVTDRHFDKWINKYQIHMFDRPLSRTIGLICLPFMYLLYRLTEGHLSKAIQVAGLLSVYSIAVPVLTQLIGEWISKKPPGSNWHNY